MVLSVFLSENHLNQRYNVFIPFEVNSFTANRLYIGEVERSRFTDRLFIGEVGRARLKPLCIVIINKNPSNQVSLCSPNYNLLFLIHISCFYITQLCFFTLQNKRATSVLSESSQQTDALFVDNLSSLFILVITLLPL